MTMPPEVIVEKIHQVIKAGKGELVHG